MSACVYLRSSSGDCELWRPCNISPPGYDSFTGTVAFIPVTWPEITAIADIETSRLSNNNHTYLLLPWLLEAIALFYDNNMDDYSGQVRSGMEAYTGAARRRFHIAESAGFWTQDVPCTWMAMAYLFKLWWKKEKGRFCVSNPGPSAC